MTRLEQGRLRQAKLRATQAQFEAVLDDVIPNLPLSPSASFEALLVYAIDGLVVQGVVYSKEQALSFVSHALTKRGLVS